MGRDTKKKDKEQEKRQRWARLYIVEQKYWKGWTDSALDIWERVVFVLQVFTPGCTYKPMVRSDP